MEPFASRPFRKPGRAKKRTYQPEFERLEVRWLMSCSATGLHRSTSAASATLLPFATAAVLPNTGGIRLARPLDFDRSPGTAVGGHPALVYDSATVSPRPILEMVLASDPGDSVPSQIQLQLTWNNGTPQSWVTFSTTGHSAGDDCLLAAQVSGAVGSTGAYPWSLTARVTISGVNTDSPPWTSPAAARCPPATTAAAGSRRSPTWTRPGGSATTAATA